MKKKYILSKIFFLLMLTVLFACSEEGAKFYNLSETDNEGAVRSPRAKEEDGKAVITWIDPYDIDVKEVKVIDLTNNVEQTVQKGVQKAVFDITDETLLNYPYELIVYGQDGKAAASVTVRLMKNWANALYSHIDYNSTKTPQTGMFYKNAAATQTTVFDIRNDEAVARMVCSAMQGIINRDKAEVYLIWEDIDQVQLDDQNITYTSVAGANTSRNKALAALYKTYSNKFTKLYVWTEDKKYTWNMAVMLSAQNNGIPVTRDLANFLKNEANCTLPEVDITNNWADQEDAYQWAINNLASGCHNTLSFSLGLRSDYQSNPWRLYDYAVASKGFVFFLDETSAEDLTIFGKIFDAMQYPAGSACMGFGYNEAGDDLNKYINTRNVGLVVSDFYSNGSYWSSYPAKAFQQRTGVPCKVEAGKIYVAISWSDGDNIQFDSRYLYKLFKYGEGRGKVPTGVTLAAGLQELNPNLMEFYYKNITQNEELTAGPSGYQFIYGTQYSMSGKYDDWLTINHNWIETAGFHTAHLWQTSEQMYFKQYMETSGVDVVFDGFNNTFTTGAAYKYLNGTIRIDEGTHCMYDGDVYRDLMSASPSERRPQFKHVYLLTNYYGFDGDNIVGYKRLLAELEKVEQEAPNTYIYMLPMDLGATIKKYIEEGGSY